MKFAGPGQGQIATDHCDIAWIKMCAIWCCYNRSMCDIPWIMDIYMGQKLQDGKKVLEMSVTNLHSKSRPVQTIHPTDLGLLPTWRSILRPPAQEFSPSWDNF